MATTKTTTKTFPKLDRWQLNELVNVVSTMNETASFRGTIEFTGYLVHVEYNYDECVHYVTGIESV